MDNINALTEVVFSTSMITFVNYPPPKEAGACEKQAIVD